MKKINKKGFTLVELLAVIVILGVLLLIAVPSVNNIITNSRKKAFLSQVKLAVENVQTTASIEKESISVECYVKITDIKLERGTWNNHFGYIRVKKESNGDITLKPYISDDGKKFSVSGQTDNLDSSYNKNTVPSGITTCSWYN